MLERTYSIPVYRVQLVRESTVEVPAITTPEVLALHLKEIATADREHMVVIHLNTKNHPIGRQVVSIGTLNATLVSPREVFKAAILASAHAVILAHNHPSGSLIPSREDIQITEAIAKAGKLIGIPLVDHVILGADGGVYSFKNDNPEILAGGPDPC